jgi:hypothetical protein
VALEAVQESCVASVTVRAESLKMLPGATWAVAGGVMLLLLAVSSRYGFHRDELYFVVAGRRLAWGFVDQPPLTPAIARLADLIPGPVSPTTLRVLPAISAGVVVVLAALLARRFGGGRSAVIHASVFAAVGGFFLCSWPSAQHHDI